jgi:hypothetical protein
MRIGRLAILITCVGLAGLGFYILSANRRGVRVYAVDSRFKINGAQYFEEKEFHYSYCAPEQELKLLGLRFLKAMGLEKTAWVQNTAFTVTVAFQGIGPALVVCGRIPENYSQLELVADNGQRYGTHGMPASLASRTNTFVWVFELFSFEDRSAVLRLTNGLYHIRPVGEKRDVGLVRVKL